MIDIKKEQNRDYHRLQISQMIQRSDKIKKGGGKSRIEKQHQKNKMTARERIEYLIDPGTHFYEIGIFAAFEMYEEHGGCPAAGVVTGIGTVEGSKVMIVANDATVKAGAWFPMTCKKNLRAQEISMENNLPIIYLVDSAGVYLPLQDEIFPDKEHFVRILEIMPECSIWEYLRCLRSWVAVSQAGHIFPSCQMKRSLSKIQDRFSWPARILSRQPSGKRSIRRRSEVQRPNPISPASPII